MHSSESESLKAESRRCPSLKTVGKRESFLSYSALQWIGEAHSRCGGGETAFGFILSVDSNAKLVHRHMQK